MHAHAHRPCLLQGLNGAIATPAGYASMATGVEDFPASNGAVATQVCELLLHPSPAAARRGCSLPQLAALCFCWRLWHAVDWAAVAMQQSTASIGSISQPITASGPSSVPNQDGLTQWLGGALATASPNTRGEHCLLAPCTALTPSASLHDAAQPRAMRAAAPWHAFLLQIAPTECCSKLLTCLCGPRW